MDRYYTSQVAMWICLVIGVLVLGCLLLLAAGWMLPRMHQHYRWVIRRSRRRHLVRGRGWPTAERPVLVPRPATAPAGQSFRPGLAPVPHPDPRFGGIKQHLVSLRYACEQGLIPRTLEHARMDRHRYRRQDYPKRVRTEDGTDLYDEDELTAWYDDHPRVRERDAVHRQPPRAVHGVKLGEQRNSLG